MTAARLVALVIALVALLGACSGGSPLARREFTRETNRICRRASADMARVHVPPFDQVTAAEHSLQRLVRIGRAALGNLHDLRPPRHEASAIDEWLAVVDQMLGEAQLAADELHRGQGLMAFAAATRADRLAARAAALAQARGLVPCRLPPLVETV